EHTAELMHFVFKNRAAAKEVGRRARAEIVRRLSPQVTGTLMRSRLLRLAELGKFPAPEGMSSDADRRQAKKNGFYRHLLERIRHVVESNVPLDSQVVVVSRGDDDLLTFTGRDGWHFPQDFEGKYAGYYPATDSEAIGQLETLRGKGGQYFLLP